MADANAAYSAALEQIRDAARSGAQDLAFLAPIFRSLTQIPSEIESLTALQMLMLPGTQIADLAPLRALTSLRGLTLDATQIIDLAPLQELKSLQALALTETQVADLAPLQEITSLQALMLNGTLVADLAPLRALTSLRTLTLNRTQVTDLTPLQKLTSLQTLWLNETHIDDISVVEGFKELQSLTLVDTRNLTVLGSIKDLSSLIEGAAGGFYGGINYQGCAACILDPDGLGKLALIEDNLERTEKTLAYLNDLTVWPPAPPEAPPQDDVLRVAPNDDGKLDIAPARPGPAEAAERLKRTLYRRLQEAFGDLERAAGNQQPEVSRRARAAQGRFAGDFAQADLVEVYLEVAWVRAEFDRRGEREGDDRFTNAAVAALNEIVTIGPGLVLDNPEVEKLEDRRRRFAHDPLPPEAAAALEKLAETIADGDAVFGETLRHYAAATLATAEGTDDRRTVIQRVVTRNTIVAIGRWLANETSKKAYSGALGLAALWALKHESMIVTAASVWGDLFLAWLGPVFDQARAIAASAQSAGAIRPPPPRRRGPQ